MFADRPGGQQWRGAWRSGALAALAIFGAALGLSAFVRTARPAVAVRDGEIRDQAFQCARTGLTEAINWLRRQPVQPVEQFAPTQLDSLDPRIGLVREFPIADGLWGRFEVWRPDATIEPDLSRRRLAVDDVSRQRGHAAGGMVWRLRCAGFVFERGAEGLPFDRRSSAVLQSEFLEVEVARLGLRLPGQAALCIRNGGVVLVGSTARIDGGDSAVGIYSGSAPIGAAPLMEIAPGSVRGVEAAVHATSSELFDDSAIAVFGVDQATLFAMADARVTNPANFPRGLPANSLCCVDAPTWTCDAAHPLRGSGILFVKGDLSIEAGSAAQFTGLLYIDGNLTVHSTASITGAVVVTGRVSIHGGRDAAELTYDDGILRGLRDAVGSYRMATPITRFDGFDGHGTETSK